MFWTYPAGKGTRPLKTTSSRSENPRRAVFVLKAGWRGATKETAMRVSAQLILGKPTRKAWGAHTLHRSSTEEQRSQTAFRTKILWTAGLLSVGGVGSAFTARSGMLRPRRLAHSQNPPPPHPSQFSDRLLATDEHRDGDSGWIGRATGGGSQSRAPESGHPPAKARIAPGGGIV